MSVLIYDGDCPFCSNYVQFLKLREKFPDLELIDAREQPQHPGIILMRERGLQVDDGMALIDAERIYYGADAIHELAVDDGINGRIFGSSKRARMLYPAMRAGRNITLKLLGKKKLGF